MAYTLQQVIASVRELSFDRFVTPSFLIGAAGKENRYLTISSTSLKITDKTVPATPVVEVELLFATYPTLGELVNALISNSHGYAVSYAASFISGDACSTLLLLTDRDITIPVAISRTVFFSDSKIIELVKMYMQQILSMSCTEVDNMTDAQLNTFIQTLIGERPKHMCLWVAWWLVDYRRMYEMAGMSLGQSTFSNTGTNTLIGAYSSNAAVDVTIGDVFRLSEQQNAGNNEGQTPWQVGADNVLGDADTFWYKLQLWIRSTVEQMFGDYSLRKDTVMVGIIDLQVDQNFYAYFDNYPYTISPLSREILSSMEWSH